MPHVNLDVKKAYYKRKSDNVKRWRTNTKDKIIRSMGGSCQICRYDRSAWALELHHLDPSEKEMSFGRIRRNPVSVARYSEELKKCILLCANCHREVHAGTTQVPEQYAKVNLELLG